MVLLRTTIAVGLAGLATTVWAHPGGDVRAEAAERAAFLKGSSIQSRSLSHCSKRLKARGLEDRNVARRENMLKQLRTERGLEGGTHYIKARYLQESSGHSSFLDSRSLFADGGACIVQPEVTQGPYYVAGELVREDVSEDQAGVPLTLDIQLIDVNTCNPIPDIYTDFWHCNATGVYSGVNAFGNGNSGDDGNIETTHLRGVQPSDQDGVVHFKSIFPGHYTGRAIHIHVATHSANETEVLPNGTIAGVYDTHSSHVGQLFFDMDLIAEVEKTQPYADNTQPLTENDKDFILAQEAETTDPYMKYSLVGDSVEEGIMAWISIGIDTTRNDDLTPAVFLTEDGPEENDDFGLGGFPPIQWPTFEWPPWGGATETPNPTPVD